MIKILEIDFLCCSELSKLDRNMCRIGILMFFINSGSIGWSEEQGRIETRIKQQLLFGIGWKMIRVLTYLS